MDQTSTNNKLAVVLGFTVALFIFMNFIEPLHNTTTRLLSPLARSNVAPLRQNKNNYEIFGFAPYWTFNNLDNVDFNVLTTLAYFDVPVDADGNLVKSSVGYETFKSQQATELFTKAHQHGSRVVLTLTQMNNSDIEALMDNSYGQYQLVEDTVNLVKRRGIDGVDIDFEYMGYPGEAYRQKFTAFVDHMTQRMHQEIPGSKVTVATYASAVKDPKIYDLGPLSKVSDGIFMMGYDFAVAGSDVSMPTSPLYGYKEGQYWYDISTAVNDFLTQMPANKLILGTAWYDWNRPVYQPGQKASTWYGQPVVQTYGTVQNLIKAGMPGTTDQISGWDDYGKVGWTAYYNPYYGVWRQVYSEDTRSLGLKYDFAKSKHLGGVGMWALGFDEGKKDLWTLLEQKFGTNSPDRNIVYKPIGESI